MPSKYWNEILLSEFKKIYETNKDKWINKEHLEQIKKYQDTLSNSHQAYKKNHNEFLYFLIKFIALPLSVLCLFIPFYWTWKKYKILRDNKNKLLNQIKNDEDNKISLHEAIFKSIDFLNIFKTFNHIISYQNCGPIPYLLIEEIKANSLFDFQDLDSNTYNSSWGVLNNCIVIHSAKQMHKKFMKTYHGSSSVSYYNPSTKTNEYDVVSATYQHEAYNIFDNVKNYFFMNSCSELEFKFLKESNKISSKFFNKKNNFSPLENKKFDNEYNWYRNNDIQFRMIFTPLAQEQFLDNAGVRNIEPEYEWQKDKSFIFNNYHTPTNIGDIVDHFNNYHFNFLVNPKINEQEFYDEIFNFITSFYFQIYQAFNFYWLTTILQSEDQLPIINAIKNQHNITDYDQYLFFHYILKELLDIKAIVMPDMDTFHSIINCEVININNTPIYNVSFSGLSYKIVKKTTYVSEYSFRANRSVSVPIVYDDYIPQEGLINIFCQKFNTKYYYYFLQDTVCSNIEDQNILDSFRNLNGNNIKVVLRNNILCGNSVALETNELKTIIDFLNN